MQCTVLKWDEARCILMKAVGSVSCTLGDVSDEVNMLADSSPPKIIDRAVLESRPSG